MKMGPFRLAAYFIIANAWLSPTVTHSATGSTWIMARPIATATALFASSPVQDSIANLEDDWFWFDPYPGPGHMQSCGDNWGFVRLAAYNRTQLLIDMSDLQKEATNDIYRIYVARQPADTAGRVAHWNEARATIEPLLSAEQISRLDGIALQRMSYRAFSVERVKKNLSLTSDQQQRIRDRIIDHGKRLGDYRTLPEKQRILKGQESHKQVWLDIRKILTREQIRIFNQLRGPRP